MFYKLLASSGYMKCTQFGPLDGANLYCHTRERHIFHLVNPTEWVSYFYLMMEAEPTSEAVCFLNENETIENVQYMYQLCM
jgi:hypothetical protein